MLDVPAFVGLQQNVVFVLDVGRDSIISRYIRKNKRETTVRSLSFAPLGCRNGVNAHAAHHLNYTTSAALAIDRCLHAGDFSPKGHLPGGLDLLAGQVVCVDNGFDATPPDSLGKDNR